MHPETESLAYIERDEALILLARPLQAQGAASGKRRKGKIKSAVPICEVEVSDLLGKGGKFVLYLLLLAGGSAEVDFVRAVGWCEFGDCLDDVSAAE
jgi:hypothetical protein